MQTNSAIEEIKAGLGNNGWVAGADMQPYIRDDKGFAGQGLIVARPKSTEEVSKVVTICAAHGLPLIPQGGNTNVTGGAVPTPEQPAVILSLARMNKILDIDPDGYTMTVEAGCIMQTMQEAARAQDREFAPDWGARGTTMAGGAVATNGGGLNVLRYGTTREQVMGLEVVLPDGRVWDGLRALHKDNSGYDLKHLFVGSEGTLGVITKIVFKLHPYQPFSRSIIAELVDADQLVALFALAKKRGGDRLTAFEMMPGRGVEFALDRYPDLRRPLETRADRYIIIRFSGAEDPSDDLMAFYEAALEQGLLGDAALAQSQAQEANIWEIRDQMIPFQYVKKVLKWDVSVPISTIMPLLAKVETVVAGHQEQAIIYPVGHFGDGNIHLTVFPDVEAAGDQLDAICAAIYDDVDKLIWDLGGSICAEHGVGIEMFDRVRDQKSSLEYELMGRIRTALDPQGIMNPGKLVERF